MTSEAWDDAVTAHLFDTEEDWLAFLAAFEVEGSVGTAHFTTRQLLLPRGLPPGDHRGSGMRR